MQQGCSISSVYKPPTTLPGMVSGLWTEGEKASGQMDNKAVWLIYYLQSLKTVALGRKGIVASQWAESARGGHFLHSSAIGTAGIRLT